VDIRCGKPGAVGSSEGSCGDHSCWPQLVPITTTNERKTMTTIMGTPMKMINSVVVGPVRHELWIDDSGPSAIRTVENATGDMIRTTKYEDYDAERFDGLS
jgi:hypothetical protein